ncbi:uncharacterized protein [Antedon mediterranea]|uniref:uncharacterized protein n=1 Tax=Antedon mediterranea TaxID=105859 RepID=UPI003AF999CA
MSAEISQQCRICKISKPTMMRCTRCCCAYYCSRACQVKEWPVHKGVCCPAAAHLTEKSQNADTVSSNTATVQCKGIEEDKSIKTTCEERLTIVIKCHKEKIKVNISKHWNGEEILNHISVAIKIKKLKLIHKGRIMNADNVLECVRENALFQAIGEKNEDEDGLNSSDIDCIVAQAKVNRNEAVRALRRTGDVVDAILYISNK